MNTTIHRAMKQKRRRKRLLVQSIHLWIVVLLLLAAGPQSAYCFGGQDCRGFDFLREFPESRGNKPSGVHYDVRRKQLTGVDGVYYNFQRKGKKSLMHLHTKDLPYSAREERYIAAYDKMEEEFDRKYAGSIKAQVREIGIQRFWEAQRIVEAWQKDKRWDGTGFIYPAYLEGLEVPAGLTTPLSIFNPHFFSSYIRAENRPGDLREFIVSTKLRKDATIIDQAGYIRSDVAIQVMARFKALSAEYVLTWYYDKKYTSPEERKQTAVDMAEYYSNVAFRGAAEGLYKSKHLLTTNQRCRIAGHVASRVNSLILGGYSERGLFEIRNDYRDELASLCSGRLYYERIERLKNKGNITKEEDRAQSLILQKKVETGEEGCRDD